VGIKFIDGEALLMMLDAAGILVTAGSACMSGSMEPSHVLKAMNVPLSAIHGSLRFCTSRYTTTDEIDRALDTTVGIVKRLREMSPFGREAKAGTPTVAEIERHKAYFARA
jgi:cysteine desulfurase